jgi:putative peptidoglycan lipid II flippase
VTIGAPPTAGAGNQPPSLVRASTAMAAGTLGSRLTGFLRTIALAAALGVTPLANAYNVGNTLPNIVYDLLLGGVLTAVVVPVLVEANRNDPDQGLGFAQSLLTLSMLLLAAVTAATVIGAPVIVHAYLVHGTAADRPLAVTFARYFLPQIFFYGVGAVIGAILNVRGRFAEPMWTPIINNVVVIAVALFFFAVASSHAVHSSRLSTGEIRLLAIGTTVGVIAQTAALLPALRRVGFRFRLRLSHGSRLAQALRLAGWMAIYVVTNQALLLVVINLADAAHGGYTSYLYAYTLFQLPYAAVSVSVITALLPRMSAGAVAADLTAVRSDLSYGLRMTAVLLVPAAVLLFLLGPSLSTIILGFGNSSASQARSIGFVFSAMAIGLVPFSAFQLETRAFYALRDTRTPAMVNLWASALNVALDVGLFFALPERYRVAGLGLGFSISYLLALALSTVRLVRRLPGANGLAVVRSHVRLGFSSLTAGLATLAVVVLVTVLMGSGRAAAVIALVVGGGVGLLVFLRTASQVQTAEVRQLARVLLGRLRAR